MGSYGTVDVTTQGIANVYISGVSQVTRLSCTGLGGRESRLVVSIKAMH